MKLARLFGAIFAMSLKRDLAFRANLVFQLLLAVTAAGATLFTLDVVYTRTQTLGGWRAGEAIVLIGTFTIVSGLLATFVEPNVTWFNQRIESGQIDEVLLRPVSSLFLASLGRHAPAGLVQVLAGLAVVAWGMRDLATGFAVGNGLAWLLLLLISFALTWATRVLIAMLALWVPGLALDVVYGGVWQFGRYPVPMYRQPARFVLTWVLPFAFITTLPARALTRGVSIPVLLGSLLLGAGVVALAHLAWAAGLRRYTSATS
jgi:ABC-2 type transport system permease protein